MPAITLRHRCLRRAADMSFRLKLSQASSRAFSSASALRRFRLSGYCRHVHHTSRTCSRRETTARMFRRRRPARAECHLSECKRVRSRFCRHGFYYVFLLPPFFRVCRRMTDDAADAVCWRPPRDTMFDDATPVCHRLSMTHRSTTPTPSSCLRHAPAAAFARPDLRRHVHACRQAPQRPFTSPPAAILLCGVIDVDALMYLIDIDIIFFDIDSLSLFSLSPLRHFDIIIDAAIRCPLF